MAVNGQEDESAAPSIAVYEPQMENDPITAFEVTNESATTREAYQPLNVHDYYEQSQAELVSTPFAMKSEFTVSEYKEYLSLEAKLKNAYATSGYSEVDHTGKGGGGIPYDFIVSVLNQSELDLYHQANSYLRARGLQELLTTETMLAANGATFIGGVQTGPGIRFNIYQANNDAELDQPVIDPKALDTMTATLLNELGGFYQNFLPQAEVARLQHLAADGKLDTVTFIILIADNIYDCVIRSEEDGKLLLRTPQENEVCIGGGVNIDRYDLQDYATSDYRNPTLMIGISNLDHTVNATLAHEIVHALVSASTITSEQRLYDDEVHGEANIWFMEHNALVEPLTNLVMDKLLYPPVQSGSTPVARILPISVENHTQQAEPMSQG